MPKSDELRGGGELAVPQLSFLGHATSFRKRSEEINPDSFFIFYDNATLHRQVRVTGRDMTRPVGLTSSGQPRLWTVCPARRVQGGRPSPPERLNATFPLGGGKRPIPYNIVLRTASPGCADVLPRPGHCLAWRCDEQHTSPTSPTKGAATTLRGTNTLRSIRPPGV